MFSGSGFAGRVTGRRDAKAQGKAPRRRRGSASCAGGADRPRETRSEPRGTEHARRNAGAFARHPGQKGHPSAFGASVRGAVPDDLMAAQRALGRRSSGTPGAVGKGKTPEPAATTRRADAADDDAKVTFSALSSGRAGSPQSGSRHTVTSPAGPQGQPRDGF